jgi:CheY-like chemotaxis protein
MAGAVLFVDDSAVARAATARLLTARGLPVTALGSSREAAAVDATLFSAALLDLELADGVGTEIARALRAKAPDLPIAFLTARDRGPLRDEAALLGPVFSKESGLEAAVCWIADRAAPADR